MVTFDKFQEAALTIKDKVIKTPLIHSPALSRMFAADIYLKLENLQKTGSFKIRGATYKMAVQADNIGPGGVVAASAGNHAQGVALAAKQAGIAATIVMPEWASITKQEATRNYGGQVVISGSSLDESLAKAQTYVAAGKTLIHPYDDPQIVAGQGTIGLEIFEELQNPDMIVVPVGGGGLISGIAAVTKTVRPKTQVIGVQTALCPSAYESLRQHKPVLVPAQTSIADGISVKQTGAVTFKLIQRHVDRVVLVEEEQIAAALLILLERKKILAEGSGAVPLAALLNGSVTVKPRSKVVLVISGGNVDSPLLGRVISQGLLKNGRIMRLRVCIDDRPGALARLLKRIAGLKANVLHIYHDRMVRDMPMFSTYVDLELETRGPEHVKAVCRDIEKAGYVLAPTP